MQFYMRSLTMNLNTVVVFLTLCVVATAGQASGEHEANQENPGTQSSEAQVVGVEEFVKNVDGPGGPFRVEGVVSAVSPDEGMIALIDTSEFDKCGVTTCAPLTLPVRWKGRTPSIRDIVELVGRVEESEGGKLVFVGEKLHKLNPDKGASDEESR